MIDIQEMSRADWLSSDKCDLFAVDSRFDSRGNRCLSGQ